MVPFVKQFDTRASASLDNTRPMRPTTVGMKALGDPNLKHQIERARLRTLTSADRVLALIAGYKPDSGGARGSPAWTAGRGRGRRSGAERCANERIEARTACRGTRSRNGRSEVVSRRRSGFAYRVVGRVDTVAAAWINQLRRPLADRVPRRGPLPMSGEPPVPHRGVKTTAEVVSRIRTSAIHAGRSLHPLARWCLAASRPVRPLPDGPLRSWRERPPSPKARYGIAASVFAHPRPFMPRVAPEPSIPAGRLSEAPLWERRINRS